MLDLIRKIFGLKTRPDVHPLDGATRQAQEAPYKLEPAPVYRDSTPEPEAAKPKLEVVEPVKKEKPKKEKAAAKPKKESKPKSEKPAEKPKKPKAKKST
jgi:hypothetical protein